VFRRDVGDGQHTEIVIAERVYRVRIGDPLLHRSRGDRDTRRLRLRGSPHALGGVLLLTLAGCAQPPSAAPYLASPIPSGMARIWFYRDMNPDELAGTPYVRLNGAPTGSAEPGAAFYRDVMPGHYHISTDSYYQDPHNDRDVDLAPGTEAYARVLLLDNFIQGSGGAFAGGVRRTNYVVWLYPAEAARPAIADSYIQASGSQVAQQR
jgi:hypothetical protein